MAKTNSEKLILPAKNNSRFVLLGGGYHICKMIEFLAKRKYPKPIILTWPRKYHERDIRLLTDDKIYLNVFDYIKNYGLELVETESTSDAKALKLIASHKSNIAFSFSWRYLIDQKFIDIFNGNVFNIHPTILPEERGAGTFSYRIMNEERFVACTIHKVNAKFDAGDTLIQLRKNINIKRPIPYDYLYATNILYEKALHKFLGNIVNEIPFELSRQDESRHTYFSRLYTEVNGAINWAWEIEEIEKFIRAFSYPYPGAFTYAGQKRISIMKAAIHKKNKNFHPFMSGKVISKHPDGSVNIITKNGILKLLKISLDGMEYSPAQKIKYTDRLYTPFETIEKSIFSSVNVKEMK